MEALTALSRLTSEPLLRFPRFVRRRVSGAAPILKYHDDSSPLLLNSVMVRQVPLTETESPSWASSRIEEHFPMVRDVPPPPEEVESKELSSVTAVVESELGSLNRCIILVGGEEHIHGGISRQGRADSLPIVSTSPVNIVLNWDSYEDAIRQRIKCLPKVQYEVLLMSFDGIIECSE